MLGSTNLNVSFFFRFSFTPKVNVKLNLDFIYKKIYPFHDGLTPYNEC